MCLLCFFFNDTGTTEIYTYLHTLSLHDALPICKQFRFEAAHTLHRKIDAEPSRRSHGHSYRAEVTIRGSADPSTVMVIDLGFFERALEGARGDRKSTRLNSSH